MRFFQISVLLLFVSCSLPTTKGYLERSVSKKNIENNYFSNEKTDYIYKAKIDIYNKKFGGILIIKKTGVDQHRIVFTTEFGNKIFDFVITNGTFKVNSVLDELNKKIILKTLQDDFFILVKQFSKVDNQYDSAKEIVYQTKYNKDDDLYYFFLKENNQLFKIVKSSKQKEKVTFDLININNDIGTKIDIIHQNFKLKIHLNYIGN
ncbi:MAG: hypothetical protein DRJ07_09315 [Bacteroidetes bacterium]|nr:MAG: hypothetical protein DRJ07_09315 [Bacteroidota bacterium]